MKKAVNISCADRVKQYPKGVLHADAGQLFCSCCNVTLDNSRKNTIDKHLISQSHIKKRKAQDDEENKKSKKQASIVGAFQRQTDSRDARNVAHFELVEAFSAANIPLQKLDHPKLREYLQTNVKNLGQLPNSASLRTDYLPKVFDLNQEQLRNRVGTATSVTVVTDEASDSQDRFVLHVIFVLSVVSPDQEKMEALTADIIYLDKVNATTVSQSVIKTLTKYNVNFDIVAAFVTDNATYMTKAFENLKGLLPFCIHMTCNAHIMGLVGEVWRKKFPSVDRLVACFKSIFTHSASRKQRFKEVLSEITGVDKESVPLPPVPVVTRWNSWLNAVTYHAKYVTHYEAFIDKELEVSTATNALNELQELLQDQELTEKIEFISQSTAKLVDLLTWFESRHIRIHLAYNKIMDLFAGMVLTTILSPINVRITVFADKSKEKGLLRWQREAFADASAKMKQYYSTPPTTRFCQPGLKFLRSVRLLDPQQAKVLSIDDLFDGIPECAEKKSELQEELSAYKYAVQEITENVEPMTFWFASRDRFPQLFKIALKYLSVTGNSVDAERSVSQYNLINTSQRQNLTEQNLTNQMLLTSNAKNS